MKFSIVAFFLLLNFSILFAQENDRIPELGNKAPNFTAIDQFGESQTLDLLLENHDNVVLFFYRGNWCPYCKKQLSELQDSLQLIIDKGTAVMVITPEKTENIEKTVKKTKATFSILHDKGFQIMKDYGVDYELSKETVPRFYRLVRAATRKANDNDEDVLPVPATFIIGKDQRIKYQYFNSDYRERASISEILRHL